MANDIIDVYFKIGVDDKPLDEGLDRAGKKALSFGDILKANLISGAVEKGIQLLESGLRKVASVIENNVAPAVSRLDTLNSYSKTMEALGFSSDQAAESQERLADAIEGLPTTLDGIIGWQQQFTALSDDIENATDLTIALNNATLAAGKGQDVANHAMSNWYTIIANGAPDAQHWRSIYSAMPAQMNQLAQELLGAGKKAEDLYDEWKAGTITTQQVTDALIKLNEEGYKPVVRSTAEMMAMAQAGINVDGVASFAEQAKVNAETIETAYGNIGTAVAKNIAKVIGALNGDSSEGGGRIVKLLQSVKALINNIGDIVSKFVSDHEPEITAIMDALNALFKGEDVSANFKTLLDNVGAIIKDLFNRAKTFFEENREEITQTIVDMFTSFVDTLIGLIPVLLPVAVTMITSLVSTLLDNLPMIIESAVQIIIALAHGLLESLPTLIPSVIDAVLLIVDTIINNIGFIIEAALQIITALAFGLIDALPKLAKAVPEIIGKIVAVLILHLPDIIMAAIEIILALAEGLIGALPYIVESVFTIVRTIKQELEKGWKDCGERAKQWGADLLQNFIDGIKKMWSNFTGAIGDIAGYIKDNIGFSEPKMGPLSNFHTFAPDMIDLFTKGLYDGQGELQKAFNDVFQAPDMEDLQVSADVTKNYKRNGSGGADGEGVEEKEVKLYANIYIGGKKIDQQVVTANARNAVVSGGR